VADENQRRSGALRDGFESVDGGVQESIFVRDVDGVERVPLERLDRALRARSDDDRMRLAAELIGERARLRRRFERAAADRTVVVLDVRDDVLHHRRARSFKKATICCAPSAPSAACATRPLPRASGVVMSTSCALAPSRPSVTEIPRSPAPTCAIVFFFAPMMPLSDG